MNIKRAKQEIKDTLQAYLLKDEEGKYILPTVHQRPVLLLGAPGIGKTQIMEQVAEECGVGLVAYTITHHTRQSAIGLPFIVKKEYDGKEMSVTEYTMSEIVASVYDQIKETGNKEGILFIDEINCVSETLAPAMLQFLQCKSFGSHKIPEGWIIAAAGNPPEYNKSVREFDVVTMDRVKKLEVQPDFDVWKEYAYHAGVHQAVISYLTARTGSFYQMETTVDGRYFATPRGWEDLSRLMQIYEKLDKAVDQEVVAQYIQHPKIARDFASYLELYHKYEQEYQVEEILQGRISENLVAKLHNAAFDERLSVVSLLLSGLTRHWKQIFRQNKQLDLMYADLRERKMAGEDSATEYTRDKEDFLALKESNEALIENTGERLEHAFDFLEYAFGAGQELVVFLTEMNINRASVAFLNDYECERYYRYNEQLMLQGKDQLIAKRIEALNS